MTNAHGTLALLLVVLASACASHRPSGEPSPRSHDGSAALEAVRRVAPFSVGQGAFERAAAAFVVRDEHLPFANAASAHARVVAPDRADHPVHLEDTSAPGTWVEITPRGLAPIAPETRQGALAFVDAAPGMDLVYAPRAGGFEESRVVYGGSDDIHASYTVKLGPGLVDLRARGSALEAIDENGNVRIGAAPPLAIDARRAKRAASVTVHRDGTVFRVDIALDARGLARPVVLDPVWTLLSAMSTPRRQHTMWTLASGKVLVSGGHFDEDYRKVSTAEEFTPSSNSWASTGNMLHEHSQGLALVLGTKRVLVAGYSELGYNLASEIYDETAKTWSAGASTLDSYLEGAAVAIGGTKALLAGGEWSQSSAEIFDLTGTSTSAPMPHTHLHARATLLKDGRVLVAGGSSSGAVDIFNPTTKVWTAGPSLAGYLQNMTVTTLDDGRVLLAGGTYGGAGGTTECYLWDGVASTWTPTGPLGYERSQHVAIKLTNGRVLVIGGVHEGNFPPDVEMFDPTTAKWSLASRLAYGRIEHAAVLLADGRVLVSGGMTDFGVSSTAEVFAPLPLGSLCKTDGECPSGPCIDGVCCDKPCNGACERCNDPSSSGTCVATASAPLPGHVTCGAYGVCTSGVCASSCTTDAQCSAGNYCNATNKCVPKLTKGTTCGAARECATGFCVDGVCCDRACSGQCEACNISGKNGSCAPSKGAPVGTRTACTGTGVGTTCGIACDGVDPAACHYPTTTAPCSADTCTSGSETHASFCDGAGKCGDTSKLCGAYACAPTSCKTSCAGPTDCAAGYYCKASVCVARDALGVACTATESCGDGLFCTDGVCCGVPTCGAGGSCATASKKGECRKSEGIVCASNAECGTGKCVDGVCCDSVCDGQCEACNVAGKMGKCSPVAGKPHGTRPSCASAGADPCSAAACDGIDRTKCVTLAGGDVSCREKSCADGTATEQAWCNGTGTCPTAVRSACSAYACDSDTKTCKTRCAADADCAEGHACVGGACVRKTASCSEKGESVVGGDGVAKTCAPYVCRDAVCLSACESSADCAVGLLCDVGTKVCRAPEVPADPADSGGGCSASRAPVGGSLWALFGAVASVLTLARRRRIALLGAFASLTGCARSEAGPTTADAGVTEAVQPVAAARARTILSNLRATAVLSPRLANGAWSSGTALEVSLPARADGAMRLAVQAEPDLWIEVTREGVAPVEATTVDGARVALDAERDTDVVHVATRDVAEEVRVVRSPRGALSSRYRLETGKGVLSVSIENGRVIARGGTFSIATDPMFAVDHAGTRRTVSVAWVDAEHRTFETALDGAGLTYPIAIDPAWSAAGTTADWHFNGILQKLGDGTVLAVAGGNITKLATEQFNPTTNTWSTTPTPSESHYEGSFGLLPTGDAVVAIGRSYAGTCIRTTEVFRKSTRTWDLRTAAAEDRRGAGFAMLADGRLFLAGGGDCSGFTLQTATAFNDATNSWAPLASMSTKRWSPTAITLTDRRVLVTGGYLWSGVQAAMSTAEIYDPTTNTWTAAAPMSMPRFNHSATRLPGGRIFVAGGERGFYLNAAEIYDPATNTWKSVAPMRVKRSQHGAALLKSGRVLVAMGAIGGGLGTSTSEVYDVTRDAWLDAGAVSTQGDYPGALQVLDDGRVLSVGRDARVYTEQALGKACTTAGECGSGYCTDGVCCGTASCPTGTSCSNLTKPGSCAKLDGMACSAGAECASDLCVDGFCCNSACGGQCEACDVLGSVGTCTAVSGQSHGARPACDDGSGNPCRATTCDGTLRTACKLPASGAVACGAASCMSGVETHASTCDGTGKCKDVPTSCGLYTCGASTCKTTCATSADCVAGYWCKANACVPTDGLGTACSTSGSCAKGLFCTDGVCCGVASCGTGATCAAPGKSGQCQKTLGTACGIGVECASGLCVDGVCCDKACDGQCEACDVAPTAGTCTTVKGAPHAGRSACALDPTKPCGNAICDGTDASKCAGFPGSELACGTPSCKDGVATTTATCDGKGACGAPTVTNCVGFACDDVSRACKLGCGSKDDCLEGFVCRGGKCVTRTDECVPNATAIAKADGAIKSCAPYVCKAGACIDSCGSTDDCAPGLVCDPEKKTCAEPAIASADEGGGCSTAPGRASGFSLFALGLAAVGLALGRRRA